jgi:hypothetical protein
MKLPEECRPFYELMQMAKLVPGLTVKFRFSDLIRRPYKQADGYSRRCRRLACGRPINAVISRRRSSA